MLTNIDFSTYTNETRSYVILEMVQKKQVTLWKKRRMSYFAGLLVIKWNSIMTSVI